MDPTDVSEAVSMPLSVPDGMRPDGVADSPTSSTGGHSQPRQKQVPIPRTTKSGYERPERARTSHACEPCRERKTKCDGERPACRRCLHTGMTCHYGYGKGWKKRKTVEDLTVTSRRLARYEELLGEIFTLVSPEVRSMINEARQQDYGSVDSVESRMEAMDVDGSGASPSPMGRFTPSHPLLTQSAPPLIGSQLPLHPSVQLDSLQSPLPPSPNTKKSPRDDSSNSGALRLPSITPQGFLVEGTSYPDLAGPHLGSVLDALRGSEQRDGMAAIPTLTKKLSPG